jgi:hypothetical protein
MRRTLCAAGAAVVLSAGVLLAGGRPLAVTATVNGQTAAGVVTATAAASRDAQLVAYSASAQSWGIDVRVVPVALAEEIPDVLDEYFPHTNVQINASPHATADGEFFDPGALVRSGPSLANGQLYGKFPPPFNGIAVPDYPYIAHATSDPNVPHDVSAGTKDPFTPEPGIAKQLSVPGVPAPSGFGAGTAHAHADSTPLATANGDVGKINLTAVVIGSASGESTASQAKGVVTATTTSVLNDISIAGLLHIGAETVTGTVTSSGPQNEKATGGVTYSGVTVAGVPATIDDTGLHIGGNGVPTAAAQGALQQLNSALAQLGATIVASSAVTAVKDSTGTASFVADGFSIAFADSGHTFTVLISFGHADLIGHALLETAQPLPLPVNTGGGPPLDTGVLDTGTGAGVTLPFAAKPSTAGPRTTASTGGAQPSQQLVSAVDRRPLILPVLAGLAELALLGTLLCAGWMRWGAARRNPDDLLLL